MDMVNGLKFFFWLVAPSGAWWRPVAEPRPTVFKMTSGAQWRPVAPLVLDLYILSEWCSAVHK